MIEQENKKDINENLVYVVDRFILANLEYNQILELSSKLKSLFGIYSEQVLKEQVESYLISRGYISKLVTILTTRCQLTFSKI